MRFRKLRIAWSVGWGLVCILLLALWCRSFWTLDLISRCNSSHILTTLGSQMGAIYFAHFDAYEVYKGSGDSYASHGWEYRSRETYALNHKFFGAHDANSLNINAPHWLLAITVLVIGAAVWLPWRFSLRTLQIVTTLIAVAMGLIAWLTK